MKAIFCALALAVAIPALPTGALAFERPGLAVAAGDWSERRERYWHEAALLPEHRVERIVRREGFVEIEDLRLRRGVYLVDAVRPNGAVFRLALDGRTGALLRSERIGWARGEMRPGPAAGRSGIEFRFNF